MEMGFRRLFSNNKARDRRSRQRAVPSPGTRILVIDDSRTVLRALRGMLRQAGFEVLEASDAESGIALAREHQPSLVFMDVVLPGLNGFEATRVLVRDQRTADIPVVIMSGNQQATEQFWVLRIGARGFMVKPFSRRGVFEHINRLLPQHEVA